MMYISSMLALTGTILIAIMIRTTAYIDRTEKVIRNYY